MKFGDAPGEFPALAQISPDSWAIQTVMFVSFLAILVLTASTLLILSNLKMVMRDIVDVVVTSVVQARFSDHLAANLALVSLWLLIFALSFG